MIEPMKGEECRRGVRTYKAQSANPTRVEVEEV